MHCPYCPAMSVCTENWRFCDHAGQGVSMEQPMKSAKEHLNEEHTKVVRGAVAYAKASDMDNYFLFYGRAQGLELAMDIIGVEFTPIRNQLP